jgi:PPOX class probable F420-dependent enzyme
MMFVFGADLTMPLARRLGYRAPTLNRVTSLEPRVRTFLEAPRYAVLATVNRDGSPHLTEMWYGVREGELFFNTTEERHKTQNLARDARVSLLVSEKKGNPIWRSLVYVRVDGRARLVRTGPDAIEDIVSLAIRYDGPDAEANARASYANMHRATWAIDVRRVYLKGL